jgi:acetyl-CoA synthetase
MSHRQTDDRYAAVQHGFQWSVPARFNMARACVGRWSERLDAEKRIAVIDHHISAGGHLGSEHSFSYAAVQRAANQLSNVLARQGVGRGDCVAIVLPQRFETAVAYMAVLQLGAVAMPLSQLFGPEALGFRLHDSQARVALVDAQTVDNLLAVRADCPTLQAVIGLDGTGERTGLDWAELLAGQGTEWHCADTLADDPAVLIYTSGTTGNPKGALIPHRALMGNLTGFLASQNWFGFDPGAQGAAAFPYPLDPLGATEPVEPPVFWSPADWAWTGGLMDALLPTLLFGQTIVAWRGRFSAELALDLMQTHAVTHSFIFPTALKLMMKAYPHPGTTHRLALKAIMSAGEAVGDAVFAYCRDELGVVVNEMFGQTEINYVVGNCHRLWPARPGSMGKAYPGHRVAVIDEQGRTCAPGEVGDVAVHRCDEHGHPDPVFFLGYWHNPTATQDKYTGDWCRTGDLATCDAQGYLWYQGRADDVFKSAGYRIGPSEIENCLVKHPAVGNAAVVPKPDAARGAVVKAYVVLAPEYVASLPAHERATGVLHPRLTQALQDHVRGQLAPYEYPKDIEFVDALPMTTTGKVQRRVLRLQEEARAARATAAT